MVAMLLGGKVTHAGPNSFQSKALRPASNLLPDNRLAFGNVAMLVLQP